MRTHNLGYPRIGSKRELKKASEAYWSGSSSAQDLLETGKKLRRQHWELQKEAGLDLVPSNDFSFYDQVLDTSLMVGAIPERYKALNLPYLDLLFAMARGYQKDGHDVTAMEMTKWFDTNYHYIVPEFTAKQSFQLFSTKVVDEFKEASLLGFPAKPVLLGPISYLLLGKEKSSGFYRLDLLDQLMPVYMQVLERLSAAGAEFVQLDEPCFSLNLGDQERLVYVKVYRAIKERFPHLKVMLASYFECYGDNLSTAIQLPVHTLHLDLVRCPSQLTDILASGIADQHTHLSLGVVDGRNIWKNDYSQSLSLIQKAVDKLGAGRLWIAPSCSLLHSPCDLDLETDEAYLKKEIKQWMAFAKQKVQEVVALKKLATGLGSGLLAENVQAIKNRSTSTLIHNPAVKSRVALIAASDDQRYSSFAARKTKQQEALHLPAYPTTTIGSFPQTKEVRSQRAKWKKGELNEKEYEAFLEEETTASIRWQEEIGIDVLVHGEFERNDMVEYFGEQLDGFAFSQNGWVQSYGSRCVKPPIIYGDVSRPHPMTLRWTSFAQSLTEKWVKGMLTGPVTILQWSFVRNDQPRSETCNQIALAIRDEVVDLERAGIKIIQIDEPAIREGLPLRRENWAAYLDWAVRAFRISASGVQDDTQIHTHMCYSEFNDIIEHIAAMDADVITIECSRSQMELLDAFAVFKYPNDIGPGVYDIHSPRVPSMEEMVALLRKASAVIPAEQLWVNPDCGLKTRAWPETKAALEAMVAAAQAVRAAVPVA